MNMLSKYNKNCIITGPLDSYCLICETYLRGQDDISLHIDKPVHVKNLESVPYFEKYKDDHIRKVKLGYYCEFCNQLFSTSPKVGIHVSETQHSQNKGLQLLKRTANGVVAFGNVFITDKAWNGLLEGTCVICNTEFENESIHKTSQPHVLNVIKINVEFVNNSVYRKIDEETFHCLTCNVAIALKKFTNHFESSDHKAKHQQCFEVANSINGNAVSSVINEVKTKKHTGITVNTVKKEVKAKTTNENDKQKNDSQFTDNLTAKNPIEFDASLSEGMKARNYIKSHGDDGQMYCLVCEWLLFQHEVSKHLKCEHHLMMLKMHLDRLEKKFKLNKNMVKDLANDDQKSSEDDANNNMLESLSQFQKNDINVDFVSSTAVCKKCSKVLDINYNSIKTHIEEHKAQPNMKENKQNPFLYSQKFTEEGKGTKLYSKPVFLKRNDSDEAHTSRSSVSSKDDEEIEAFAAKNNLRFRDRRVYCNLCHSYLPTSLKNMKQHIDGANHRYKMSKPSTVAKVTKRGQRKVEISEFVSSVVGIQNSIFQDVVINDNLCLNILSLLFIKPLSNSWICHSCDITLGIEDIEDHKKAERHHVAVQDALVVVVDSEFIREIRTDKYHCGFCNIVETSWDAMEEHLKSSQHKQSKNAAEWRLRQHKPEIREHAIKQQLHMLAFLNMVSNDRDSDSDNDWY